MPLEKNNVYKFPRDLMLKILETHLTSADKRYLFVKLFFPYMVARVQLEGTITNCCFAIYDYAQKNNDLAKLMTVLNTYLDANLKFEN